MAVQVDTIRATAERVAASHHLEVVDVEFVGSGKARTLRVYVEKDAPERAKLKERLAAGEDLELPKGVPVELLSGVTHEDCAEFARDFGTLLDVEDAVPGADYMLEVSSPGLERKLTRPEEYERFAGSLVKVKTFTPVNGSKVWTGRIDRIRADHSGEAGSRSRQADGQGEEGRRRIRSDGDSTERRGEGEPGGGDLGESAGQRVAKD